MRLLAADMVVERKMVSMPHEQIRKIDKRYATYISVKHTVDPTQIGEA